MAKTRAIRKASENSKGGDSIGNTAEKNNTTTVTRVRKSITRGNNNLTPTSLLKKEKLDSPQKKSAATDRKRRMAKPDPIVVAQSQKTSALDNLNIGQAQNQLEIQNPAEQTKQRQKIDLKKELDGPEKSAATDRKRKMAKPDPIVVAQSQETSAPDNLNIGQAQLEIQNPAEQTKQSKEQIVLKKELDGPKKKSVAADRKRKMAKPDPIVVAQSPKTSVLGNLNLRQAQTQAQSQLQRLTVTSSGLTKGLIQSQVMLREESTRPPFITLITPPTSPTTMENQISQLIPGSRAHTFRLWENDSIHILHLDFKSKEDQFYNAIITENVNGLSPTYIYGNAVAADGKTYCLVQFREHNYIDIVPPKNLCERFPGIANYIEKTANLT